MWKLWHLLTIDQCINNVLTIESESESERKHSLKGDKCLGFQITNEWWSINFFFLSLWNYYYVIEQVLVYLSCGNVNSPIAANIWNLGEDISLDNGDIAAKQENGSTSGSTPDCSRGSATRRRRDMLKKTWAKKKSTKEIASINVEYLEFVMTTYTRISFSGVMKPKWGTVTI